MFSNILARTISLLLFAICFFFVSMMEAQDMSPEDEKLLQCCIQAFDACCQGGDERGSFNMSFCQAYDYYGNTAQINGTEKLKACQACIDQQCPAEKFYRTSKNEDEKVRLPIIFLPGVAGTILSVKQNYSNAEVWPTAPRGTRVSMGLLADGKTPAIPGSHIVVGEILRGGSMNMSTGMNYYGGFLKYLMDQGWTEGTNLFVLAYDWRLDNAAHFPALDTVIDNALQKNPKAKKVILTAHSMGGYIARSYLLSDSARSSKVDSLITMGTPYWGAAKPYYALVNGYQFGNSSVAQPLMKILAQNFPAAYQLMPNYLFLEDTTTNRMLSLDESFRLKYKAVKIVAEYPYFPRPDQYEESPDNVWGLNADLVKLAKDLNEKNGPIRSPNGLPSGVKNYVIIGLGVKTLDKFLLRAPKPGERYIEVDHRKVVMEPHFGDGDGTVPRYSAELATATKTYYIPYVEQWGPDQSSSHAELPGNKTVQSIVGKILEGNPPDSSAYPDYKVNTNIDEEKGVDFTLHSDAYLTITDVQTGRSVGFTSEGGIKEEFPSGTFLFMDGIEYASIADVNRQLRATVTGIQDGKFSLDVKITKNGKVSKFTYPEVPVTKGTVAEVAFIPGQISAPPSLQVTTAGVSTSIQAVGDQPEKKTAAGGQFLGCFKDPNNPYDLDGFLERNNQNTPERCIKLCAFMGFKYAGVQYSQSCLCGNSYGKFGPADNCNMACTGDPNQICGGYNANSVFATGN